MRKLRTAITVMGLALTAVLLNTPVSAALCHTGESETQTPNGVRRMIRILESHDKADLDFDFVPHAYSHIALSP